MMALLRTSPYYWLQRQSAVYFTKANITNAHVHGIKLRIKSRDILHQTYQARTYHFLSKQCKWNSSNISVSSNPLWLRQFSQLTRLCRSKRPLLRHKSNVASNNGKAKFTPPKSSDIFRLLSLAKPEKWKLVGKYFV